jgi:hypothetical protein
MFRMLPLLLLCLGVNAVADAQTVLLSPTATQNVLQPPGSSLNANVFEQIRYADQFPGSPNVCAQINNAILDLASSGGGVVDARAFTGNVTCSGGGVNLNIPVKLLLGNANFSWSFSTPLFTVTSVGASIEGLGRFKSTTLLPPAGSTAIYVAQGLESTAIRHLSIFGTNSSTPSWGIAIDAAPSPANNSGFMIEDVYIFGGFGGILAKRAINSTLKDVRVSATVSDGFTFAGDGTTVTCINCYANGAGGNGFHVSGMANATFIGGEADTNGGDGLLADMSTPWIATTGLTLSGLDIEKNKGSGIHLVNASGTSISGSNVINNTADGIQMCGGVGLTMSGGRPAGNGGYAVDLAPAGCPYTGSSSAADVAVISPVIDVANAAGIVNDPGHMALLYLPSKLSPFQSAGVVLGGALWGVGTGTPSGACTTGSVYSNLSGGIGTTLYACEGFRWIPK